MKAILIEPVHGEWPVPFTRFTLPNGQRSSESWPAPSVEVFALAHQLLDHGMRFEIELLGNGVTSATVAAEVNGEWDDIDFALGVGTEINGQIEAMIRRVAKRKGG